MTMEVWFRRVTVTNTDPQRRCYDGVNFSEEISYSEWALFGVYKDLETAEQVVRIFKCSRFQYEVR